MANTTDRANEKSISDTIFSTFSRMASNIN